MSMTTFRSIACLVALNILIACSDDATAPPPPEETNVTVESGNAVSQSIGSEGGTLQTTANDGTVYTLEIPEGSIPSAETITMTPVVEIDGYPVADGVAAGVEFKPAGLVFAVPAILTIETTKTPGAGTTPVAITYEGDATSFAPGFVGTGTGTFTIPLEHFSGWTVGFATAQELASIISNTGSGQCLWAAFPPAAANDRPAAIAVFRSCFASEILPAIVAATTDRDLAVAIGQYNMWKTDTRIALFAPSLTFDDASETQQAMNALVPKLVQAIIANNDKCRQQNNLLSATSSIAKVLFWQRQAAHFGIDTVANLLDRNTVLNNLCIRPVVDSFQLPANMQVGFPHSVDIRFGVILGGQQPSKPAAFNVTLTGNGISIQNPTGFTDFLGRYTTVVTATQQGGLSVLANGCLVLPGTTTPTDICVVGQGSGSSGLDLTGTWNGTRTVNHDWVEPVSLILNQNQNAISGTYTGCGFTIGRALTATLSGNELLDVTVAATFDPGGNVAEPRLRGTGTVSGSTITLHLVGDNASIIDIQVTRGGTCPPVPGTAR